MKYLKLLCLVLFAAMPMAVHANDFTGFLSTIISTIIFRPISLAIFWLPGFVFSVVVEGWITKRWGWAAPYKNSFWANFWSLLAVIVPMIFAPSSVAALIFMTTRWLLPFCIRAYYYRSRNPSVPKSHIYGGTAFFTFASYFLFYTTPWLIVGAAFLLH